MGGYFEKKKKISQTRHKHLLGTITSSVKSVQYRVTKTLPLYSLNPDPPSVRSWPIFPKTASTLLPTAL